jgi:hypothetical protein
MPPGGVRVGEALPLGAVLTDESHPVSEGWKVGGVDCHVLPQARKRGLEGGRDAVETVRESFGMLAELDHEAVAGPQARRASESVLQAGVILDQGRRPRPCREAVQSLDETGSNERAGTVALAPSAPPPQSVKLHDQGCYFGRIEKRGDFVNGRATRYLARCHRRSLSCGRAPGSATARGLISLDLQD